MQMSISGLSNYCYHVHLVQI